MIAERTEFSKGLVAATLVNFSIGAVQVSRALEEIAKHNYRKALGHGVKAAGFIGAGLVSNALRNIEDQQTGVSTNRRFAISPAESARLYWKFYSDPKNRAPIEAAAASFNAASRRFA